MTVSALLGLGSTLNKPVVATPTEPSEATVASHFNEVQKELISLKETVSKPAPTVNVKKITKQLATLSNSVAELREETRKQLAETLTQTQDTLGKELHSIKEVVTHMGDKKPSVTYLPLANLPFSIVSIDSIQQVPVASVVYDLKTVPLEKGDSIAGWKVVRVDYSKQRLELENRRHERVLVTQEHIG